MEMFMIYCNDCDYRWEQHVESIDKVNWVCPKCNKTGSTRGIGYAPSDPEEFYSRVMKWEGGTKHA
jgi:ribosomal protein L37AE/L43A